jgi:hypothetical protein
MHPVTSVGISSYSRTDVAGSTSVICMHWYAESASKHRFRESIRLDDVEVEDSRRARGSGLETGFTSASTRVAYQPAYVDATSTRGGIKRRGRTRRSCWGVCL